MHCTTEHMSIGNLYIDKNRIDLDPPYQRETGVWSLEKKQLFIDSILNRFDIPKLYFHDRRSEKGPVLYSVIDGKQRLHAVWGFLQSQFPLSSDFALYEPQEGAPPKGGHYFRDLSPENQDRFKGKILDIVLVQPADEEDIEELFSRLNNGEPLNAAERRNAMKGDMCALIREIAQHPFFKTKLSFSNKRYSHYEVAAKLLKLESNELSGGGRICDLKKRHLDDLVEKNRSMSDTERSRLVKKVHEGLGLLQKIFADNDPLLNKQSYPQMYYIFAEGIVQDYAHQKLNSMLRDFFPKFAALRAADNQKTEDERDWYLGEYGRLTMQGTNDLTSMEWREEILRRHFLQWYPEVEIRDQKRLFNQEERYVIWYLSGCACSKCGRKIKIEEMDADHVEQWAHGGKTVLSNARALCQECNRQGASRVQ